MFFRGFMIFVVKFILSEENYNSILKVVISISLFKRLRYFVVRGLTSTGIVGEFKLIVVIMSTTFSP